MKYHVKYYGVKRLTWTDQLEPPANLKKCNRMNQLHHYRDSIEHTETELPPLLFKGLNSLSPLFQLITVRLNKHMLCRRKPFVLSEDGSRKFQLHSHPALEKRLRTLGSVCNKTLVKLTTDSIELGQLAAKSLGNICLVQLLDKISFCKNRLMEVTM